MASDDAPSLRKALDDAQAKHAALDVSPDATTAAFASSLASLVAQYTTILDQTRSLALFSANETLEDVATSSLAYMTIDYTLAELMQRQPFSHPSQRRPVLASARAAYERFLSLIDSYGLVHDSYASSLRQYHSDPASFSVATAGQERRAAKLAAYRAEKSLADQLALLRQRGATADEDILRQTYLADIAHKLHKTFDALDSLNQEEGILALAPSMPDAPDHTTRLDAPLRQTASSSALLSRSGKPLQPFTLVSSRADLARGVFRPGHNLPTMSIDEYLAEEKRRGNILQGGAEPTRIIDEDDMRVADAETYKAREWDDFKDDNRRGAGNTLNLG